MSNSTQEQSVDSLGNVNKRAFSSDLAISELEVLRGFSDPGEFAAFESAAPFVRGAAVLDLGVGPGRTIPILHLLTDSYIGLDYSPEMVALCKARYPEDIRLADARDLSQFADEEFGFVVFSFNGIDTLDHGDRAKALREMTRVLAPAGTLLYSTLNKDGPSYREVPWQLHRSGTPFNPSVRAFARGLFDAPRQIKRLAPSIRNFMGNRSRFVEESEWGIRALRSHNYSPVVHFTTLNGVQDEASRNGLEIVAIFGMSGEPIDLSQGRSNEEYFHIVARRK